MSSPRGPQGQGHPNKGSVGAGRPAGSSLLCQLRDVGSGMLLTPGPTQL